MKSFTIIPLTQVGDIPFMTNRDVVRAKLGDYKEFKKTNLSKTTTDDFGFCHVFYDALNQCEAIEFFPGLEIELILNGTDVAKASLDDIHDFLAKADNQVEKSEDMLISTKLGISLYVPSSVVESIMFFCEGYY